MKKKLGLLFLSALLLTSCGIKVNISYEDADKYSIGDATITDSILNLDIDWVSGDVEVKTHSENTIEIKDECQGSLADDNKLHYLVDGNTLKIKYRKSSPNNFTIRSKKNLIITVPENMKFDSYLIDSIDGNIKGFLFAENVKIDCVSGNSEISTNCDYFVSNFISGNTNVTFSKGPSEIKCESVSGNIKINLPNCTGFTADFSSIENTYTISEEFENYILENNKCVYGDGSSILHLKTTSGEIEISR